MSEPALLDALERLQSTGPEFNGFLANHGPMAAEALVQMGHTDRVPAWVDRYRTLLDAAPEVRRGIDAHDWQQHLGDVRLIGDWTELLRREAAEMTWTDVLSRWWPRLLPGMAASATHGVIRTAHAVRSLAQTPVGTAPEPMLVDELAQGLGLWAGRYQTLPGAPRLAGTLQAVEAIANLPRLDPEFTSEAPGVGGRLRALDHLPAFGQALDGWGPGADPDLALDSLIGAAARVLAARADAPIAFCHGVTAPAAVRIVLPHLPIALRNASVAASWQVVGAIVAAFAAPRTDAESASAHGPEPTEDQLLELSNRAVQHGDEHVIKLTEAALREFRRTNDVTLIVAADRFRGRVAPPD